MKRILLLLAILFGVPSLGYAQIDVGGGGGGSPLPAGCSNAQVATYQTSTGSWVCATVSGSGLGDTSTNTATSVANEITVFADTTGKLLKRSAITGLVLSTSGVASAYGGASCTSQLIRGLSAVGAATCATVTSSFVDTSVAITGSDINTSSNVTATHLAAALPVAQGGTGLASGTSGGILAYTASGTLASSGALTANLPVIGGGAGVAPTVGTRSGNTTKFVTTTGTLTSGDCVKIDASGNFIANGSACSSGSGDLSSNTSSSVDSEVMLFSGTGGKTAKRASTTGLAKLTSGVLSAAAAGTDYAAATTGSANIPLFNNGSGGFTNGTKSGSTNELATVTGTLTTDHCAKFDASGNIVDAGQACGAGGGGGTVTGDTGATDNAILRANGTGGSTLQNSLVTIDDSGNLAASGTVAGSGFVDTTETRTASVTISKITTLCDPSSADVTLTLPSASTFARQLFYVKQITSAAHLCTVAGTIDGNVNEVLGGVGYGTGYYSNGTSWYAKTMITPVLTNPAADVLVGFDNTDAGIRYFTIGAGLSYDHATHTLSSSGGGGTGCTVSGSAGQLITDDGSSGCTSNSGANYASGKITLGVNTSVLGALKMFGSTSGDVTIQPNAVAGTSVTLTAPAISGTLATTTGSTTTNNCAKFDSSGRLVDAGAACGGAAGTVTTTGSPASGNLAKFSGSATVTSGDLAGDVTTSGTLTTTLSTTGVTGATYGDSTHVGTFTVDTKGRITAASNVAISGGGGGGTSDDYLTTLQNAEVSITSATTATISKQHVISGTSANYTVNLPACASNGDKFISFRIATTATKLFTLDGSGSETIDGALTRIMWAGEAATLHCDGTNWHKIAGKSIPMMASMYLTGNQSVSDTSLTRIDLDTTLFDNSGLMADTTNHRINIARGGTYTVSGTVLWNPTHLLTAANGYIVDSSVSVVYAATHISNQSANVLTGSAATNTVTLTSSDQVKLAGLQINASIAAENVYGGVGDVETFLTVKEANPW